MRALDASRRSGIRKLNRGCVPAIAGVFPSEGIAPTLVKRYNAISAAEMEHVRDFSILHYLATARDEPMWRARRAMHVGTAAQLSTKYW